MNSTTCTLVDFNYPQNETFKLLQTKLKDKCFHMHFECTNDMNSTFLNDYYTNNICWSSENVIAVATEDKSVNLWNANTGTVSELKQTNEITSISWNKDGSILAIGFSSGQIDLLDTERSTKIGQINGHKERVPVLSWNPSQTQLLSSGSDTLGNITTHDIRSGQQVASFQNNCNRICGLSWSPNGVNLASSGSDNEIHIWKLTNSTDSVILRKHKSSVKALAWSPSHEDQLVSGGGIGDGKINIWDTESGSLQRSIGKYNTQTFGIIWSKLFPHLLIGSSLSKINTRDNVVRVYNLKMQKSEELIDEKITEGRLVNLAESPRGGYIVGAVEKNLLFWKVTKDGLVQTRGERNCC